MRIIILLAAILFSTLNLHKPDERLTNIDFVQILNENKEEALYYYHQNWKVLRNMAVDEGYIHSYQLLETPYSEEAPFHLMLITTYSNQREYDKREEQFAKLIGSLGDTRLLNDKKPVEFRKVLLGKDNVRHWH